MNLSSLFSFARRRSAPTRNDRIVGWGGGDSDRLRKYQRFIRSYLGYSLRAPIGASVPVETRRLRHNFNAPIINLGAAFLAGKPLRFRVDGDEAATKEAFRIWDRSGTERAFLDAARCAGIYGEIAGLATQDADGLPRIEFVCPDICFPTFAGSDAAKLTELDITWDEETRDERRTVRREFYTETGRQVFVGDREQPDQEQSWDAIPAVWIRNLAVKGFPHGFSDLDGGVADLVEEYDHVAAKRTRIVDYYASPTIVCEGVESTNLDKSLGTVLFVPQGAKVYFLEWSGNQPDVELQLSRIRNDISEMSQVPAVAFGRQDSGFSNISGVALRILYGPLLAKTGDKRGQWGPSLEYLMWVCLRSLPAYRDVRLEAVNVLWQEPLPVDEVEVNEAEKIAVTAGFRSLESSMSRTGVENPRGEAREVLRDHRFTNFKTLMDAGASLTWAARQAGFTRREVADLEQEKVAGQQQALAIASGGPNAETEAEAPETQGDEEVG